MVYSSRKKRKENFLISVIVFSIILLVTFFYAPKYFLPVIILNQFDAKDNRIKSGMTASVTIITFSKPNVVVIPGGVVFERDGKKFVQVKVEEEILEKEVVLGITSSLGQVEVVSGLSDGDKVILNPEVE